MSNDRIGSYFLTFSGRRFYPLDPRPEDICLEDIAHGLSNICRFGGHSRIHYSVAQHSCLVSRICDPADALWGLCHDAAEAYVGDMVSPIKHHIQLVPFVRMERRILECIAGVFDLPGTHIPLSVKRADKIALATEARDCAHPWEPNAVTLPDVIVPLSPAAAKAEFLARFEALTRKAA